MKNSIIIFVTLCFLCMASPLLSAQEEKTIAVPILKYEPGFENPVISADEYILMPGDSVLITITGSTNYSYITGITLEGKLPIHMPVSSATGQKSIMDIAGQYEIHYDIVGAVPIHNLNINTARDSLQIVFLHYFRRINVDITLLSMRTFIVLVAGEVKRPGRAFARPVDRVSTVIDTVGGVTGIGSRSKIELRRNDRLIQLVDLEEFERTGNTAVNPYVHDGDVIYVPRVEKSVLIIGAVFDRRGYGLEVSKIISGGATGTPYSAELTSYGEITSQGSYELIEGETVSDIIAKVNVTPWADLTKAYVERNDKKMFINLANVLADENSAENIEMKDRDVLYVPTINAVVYVQGQVTNPGSFIFQPNLKASDYIGLAGGPLDEASITSAYIKRGEKKISTKEDPMIEKGDIIHVPRQFLKFWQDYMDIAAVVGALLISYLTLIAK